MSAEETDLPPGCTWKILDEDGDGGRWIVAIIRGGEAIRGGGPDRTRGITTIGQVKRRMAELLWSDIDEALNVLGETRDEYKAMQRDRRAMKLLRENALKDEANPDLDCYLQSYGPRWHFDHTAIGSDGERSRTFSNDYEDPAEAIIAALGESS